MTENNAGAPAIITYASIKVDELQSDPQLPFESSELQKLNISQPDLSKQPSRTSNRAKNPVNYNSMLAGNTDPSSFDLAANNSANAKLVNQKKNRKRNEGVFVIVNDLLQKIK